MSSHQRPHAEDATAQAGIVITADMERRLEKLRRRHWRRRKVHRDHVIHWVLQIALTDLEWVSRQITAKARYAEAEGFDDLRTVVNAELAR